MKCFRVLLVVSVVVHMVFCCCSVSMITGGENVSGIALGMRYWETMQRSTYKLQLIMASAHEDIQIIDCSGYNMSVAFWEWVGFYLQERFMYMACYGSLIRVISKEKGGADERKRSV